MFFDENRCDCACPTLCRDSRSGRGRWKPVPTSQLRRQFLWHPTVKGDEKDYYVAFRGTFELPAQADVNLNVLGAAWYVVWCDGQYLTEGPPRFPIGHPEYQSHVAASRPRSACVGRASPSNRRSDATA